LSEIYFIAYRAKYFVSRREIENIKKIFIYSEPTKEIDLFEEKSEEKNTPTLQERFKIFDLEPYKNIFVKELPFNNRIQNLLKRNKIFTLHVKEFAKLNKNL
jgi:hypothetical protein